jgi:HK97 family phage portal protein
MPEAAPKNLIDRLAVRWLERRTVSLTQPPRWLVEYFGSPASYSGKAVTVEGALTVTAVLAGFSILMEDTASLPLVLYRRLARGKERAADHPLYRILHDAPNPEMTSMVFREIVMGHLLGWGNFYGQMIWDERGRLTEIWPLNPARMDVVREKGERRYLYRTENEQKLAFRQEQIFHVPAFGFDGVKGYSRIALARNAIGLAMTAEEFGSKTFANGARPQLVLKHPNKFTDPKAIERLKQDWEDTFRGSANAGKTAVLEEGMGIEQIGFPPEDAQFLQTRQFQVAEIARIFRIPPHMLGDVTGSTSWGTGIEQQEQGYLNHTLRPWLVRVEQQANKDLLLEGEQGDYFAEHLTEAMLRTDLSGRMQAYTAAIMNGVMSRNEVRERENLNPYEGGDEFLVPVNLGSGQNRPDPDQGGQPRSIVPLLDDVIARIARRETKEREDALKRCAGKPEKLAAWVEKFYRGEFVEFVLDTLAPLQRSGLIDFPEDVSDQLSQFAERQGHALAAGADTEDVRAVLCGILMDQED